MRLYDLTFARMTKTFSKRDKIAHSKKMADIFINNVVEQKCQIKSIKIKGCVLCYKNIQFSIYTSKINKYATNIRICNYLH